MILNSFSRIYITGMTQSGKSFFTKKKLIPQFKNYVIYDYKREYSAFGKVCRTEKQFLIDIKKHNKIVYQPKDLSPEHFNLICGIIFAKLKHLVLVVDEVQEYCTKSKIPPNFSTILKVGQGKDYRIGVISLSQRPQEVHNTVASQSANMFIFKMFLPNDLKMISSYTGISVEKLRDLKLYDFYIFDLNNAKNKVTYHNKI